MKRILIVSLIIVGFIVALSLGAYSYYGGFANIEIQEKEAGGEILVYKSVTGSYSQVARATDEVYAKLLNTYKIDTYRSYGLYFDNPQEVEVENLRSEVGCILQLKDTAQIEDIQKDFKVRLLPKQNYVVTQLPFKGIMSVMIGLMRVYPALTEYQVEHKNVKEGAIMEIYDLPNQKITYIAGVTLQPE